MKKMLLLLLSLVLCMSLCACGSGNETQASSEIKQENTAQTTTDDSSTEEESEASKNEQVVLHLNEKVTFGDLELTIIDVRIKDGDGYSVNYSTGGRHYGGPSVVVTYSLKNIGKVSARPPQGMLQLNYADGYTFIHDVYINGKHPNIFENGGVNTPDELEILSSEQYYLEAFTIPQEVLDNTENPLYLTLFADSSIFRFDIRPMDDTQTEAFYQQAVSLMDEKRYASASENLMMIQQYKDANDLLLECCLKSTSGYEYLTERKDDLRVLSSEELQTILPGTWETSQSETWVFYEDGTLDPGRTKPDGSEVITNWSVSDDGSLQTGSWLEGIYEVREVFPNGLIVFTSEGKCYHRMWKAA